MNSLDPGPVAPDQTPRIWIATCQSIKIQIQIEKLILFNIHPSMNKTHPILKDGRPRLRK